MGSIGDGPPFFCWVGHLKVAPYNPFIIGLHLVLYSKKQIFTGWLESIIYEAWCFIKLWPNSHIFINDAFSI